MKKIIYYKKFLEDCNYCYNNYIGDSIYCTCYNSNNNYYIIII